MSKKKPVKRENGKGSVTTRSDGRIMGRYVVNGERKTIYGKKGESEADVLKRVNKIVAEIEAGIYIEPSKIKLSDYLMDWLQVKIYPTIRRSTYSSYEKYFTRHIIPVFGDTLMKNLNTKSLQIFFNEKSENGRLDGQEGGLSAKTLSNMYNLLHYALDDATKGDEPIIARNPLVGVKLGKGQMKEMRVLTVAENTRLQSAARKSMDTNAFAIIFTLNTGLRIGELLGLKWSDIDYEKHTIKIRRTVQRLYKKALGKPDAGPLTEVVLGDPKSKSSVRTIPLFSELWNELISFKLKQSTLANGLGRAYENNDLIFCTMFGKIIEPRTFEDVFKDLVQDSHIKNATFHTLRHTFATRALEAGMDVKVLSSILGHSHPSTTLNLYAHALPDHKVESMEKMRQFYSLGQGIKNSDKVTDFNDYIFNQKKA